MLIGFKWYLPETWMALYERQSQFISYFFKVDDANLAKEGCIFKISKIASTIIIEIFVHVFQI